MPAGERFARRGMSRGCKVLMVLSTSLLIQARVETAAGADCWLDCMQRSGCWSGGSSTTPELCGYNNSHIEEMCRIQCKGTDTNSWGAIAYSSKDKISGWSNNQDDKTKAEKMAIQYCVKEGGAKCVIDATFNNT